MTALPPYPPSPTEPGMTTREGEHRRDGGIDGIAALAQHFDSRRSAERMAGRDRCRICDDLTRHFNRGGRCLRVLLETKTKQKAARPQSSELCRTAA